ncbi:MAG: tetratricopeptide repeat protein [Goleter apudmare HA4340-LM2]|nr:tetratricopeptide repeat protein [Goleter apudmare HA4340-LM2]
MTGQMSRNNPYVIGRPIYERELFFGREDLFQFIDDQLRQNVKVILLHGQRRIGKSTVLCQIPYFVDLPDFVFVTFDLQGLASEPLGYLLHNLAQTICDRLNLPTTQVILPQREEMKHNPQLFADTFLPQVYTALNNQNLVLLLDEFDVLNDYHKETSSEHFFPYLQSLVSGQEKLVIIPVVGRRLEDMPILLNLFRGAANYNIGLLDASSTQGLIVNPAQDLLQYTPDAIAAINNLCAGHPYFTQLLCYALFTQARDSQRFQVQAADVENIVDKAIELGMGGLAWFRDGLSIPERVIFSAVAESQNIDTVRPDWVVGEPLRLLKEYGVEYTEQLRQAGDRLVEWNFLRQLASPEPPLTKIPTYNVTLELVRRWLIQEHSLRREIRDLENLDDEAHGIYEIADRRRKRDGIGHVLNLYEQVLAFNPNHFSALFTLADGYLEIANFRKAVEFYKRAYQLDPIRNQEGFVRSLLGYGEQLSQQHQLDLAKEQLQLALLIEPDHALAQEQLKALADHTYKLDLIRFFNACNPSKTLNMEDAEDRQYYIDFSSVRGSRLIEALSGTIIRSANDTSCQLFTGHIGCGKSTELLRLKLELERKGFHVVYFESSQDMDMVDLDISDVLLAIARHVSESLEAADIKFEPSDYFNQLFSEVKNFLLTPIDFSAPTDLVKLSVGISRITTIIKNDPKLRRRLRDHLEAERSSLLQAININLLAAANQQLQQQGKKGLVVIVDNLDRVDMRLLQWGRSQPEHLFIDRGDDLRKLQCHVIYTIPQVLIFSAESEALTNGLGGGVHPRVLPMIPVQLRDGSDCPEGIALLRQTVMVRAFPEFTPEKRLDLVSEVFDHLETLDRLCRMSGGHVRKLLSLLYECLCQEDPPLSRECIETVIENNRNHLTRIVTIDQRDLLRQVVQQQIAVGEEAYQILLRNMFIFEYQYSGDRWFAINPLLAEAERFMQDMG